MYPVNIVFFTHSLEKHPWWKTTSRVSFGGAPSYGGGFHYWAHDMIYSFPQKTCFDCVMASLACVCGTSSVCCWLLFQYPLCSHS